MCSAAVISVLLVPTDLCKTCAGGRAGYTAFTASKTRWKIAVTPDILSFTKE